MCVCAVPVQQRSEVTAMTLQSEVGAVLKDNADTTIFYKSDSSLSVICLLWTLTVTQFAFPLNVMNISCVCSEERKQRLMLVLQCSQLSLALLWDDWWTWRFLFYSSLCLCLCVSRWQMTLAFKQITSLSYQWFTSLYNTSIRLLHQQFINLTKFTKLTDTCGQHKYYKAGLHVCLFAL